jgi:hypothetical protein
LKVVKERVGTTLEAMGISKDFLSRSHLAQKLRERIDKCDYMTSKVCTTKDMVSKLKRPPIEWEKFLLAIHQTGTDNQVIQGAHKTKLPKNQ